MGLSDSELRTARYQVTGRYGGTVESAVRAALTDPAAGDEGLLQALRALEWLRGECDRLELGLIEELRNGALRHGVQPMAWSRIGDALGVSRQGAERRYLRSAALRSVEARDPDEGRAAVRRWRSREADRVRRSVARWGRSGPAGQAWSVRLTIAGSEGEEEFAVLRGAAGTPPEWTVAFREGGGIAYLPDITEVIVAAVDETSPWPDIAPVEGTAGFTDEAQPSVALDTGNVQLPSGNSTERSS